MSLRIPALLLAAGSLLLLGGCATRGGDGDDARGGDSVIHANGNARVRIKPTPVPPTAASPTISGPVGTPTQDGFPASDEIPPDLADIPDAVPQNELPSSSGNPESYYVYGTRYVVMKSARGFVERGRASWYGKKFHGRLTSSGEPYDMFKMTAAHKTLPIPCYVRVTNLSNNRSVVVRVNDRGPFHTGRIVDLSYAAAIKLDLISEGSADVVLEAVQPDERRTEPLLTAQRKSPVLPPVNAPATAEMHALPDTGRPATAVAASSPSPRPTTTTVASAAQEPPEPALKMTPTMGPERVVPIPNAPLNAGGTFPVSNTRGASSSLSGEPRWLQTGMFNDATRAAQMREQLLAVGLDNVQVRIEQRGGTPVHRVLVGPYSDPLALENTRERLSGIHVNSIPVKD